MRLDTLLLGAMDYLGFVQVSNPVAAVKTPPGLVDVQSAHETDQAEQKVGVEEPKAGAGGQADSQEQQSDGQPDLRDTGVEPVRH